MSELPIKKLGPYVVSRVIGRGGMGVVYEATHEETEAPAAIKLLAPGLATDPGFRERFESEIESLRKLRHPNIVQLYGFGEQDGHLFYAMELINGTNLHEELNAGRRFNWREVTRISIDVCKALKHAHDSGVIHRDLKPANLVIDENDNVKLTDFGIAKLFGATQVTAGHGVVGTADYMSPEQAEGKPVSPRCDLYSLGAVMYSLLAGRPPFTGKSLPEVVHKVRFDDPLPVSRFASEVPAELEDIISQLLSKEPQDRFPTALVLSKRLRTLEHALSVRGQTPSTASSRSESFDLADQQTAVSGIQNIDSRVAKRATVAVAATEAHDSEADVDEAPSEEDIERRTHFTSVSPKSETGRDTSALRSTIIAAALVAVLAGSIAAVVYYARRPPSAEVLLDRIEQCMAPDERDSLLTAEADIERFLTHYPDHDRHEEIADLGEEARLLRLERSYQARVRKGQTDSESTVEFIYMEALRLVSTDREQAAFKLQTMLAVYGSGSSAEQPTRDCLQLARMKLAQITEDIAEFSKSYRTSIQARLQYAVDSDDKHEANAILGGIIALYGDKPWAADLVQQARSHLDQLADTKP